MGKEIRVVDDVSRNELFDTLCSMLRCELDELRFDYLEPVDIGVWITMPHCQVVSTNDGGQYWICQGLDGHGYKQFVVPICGDFFIDNLHNGILKLYRFSNGPCGFNSVFVVYKGA